MRYPNDNLALLLQNREEQDQWYRQLEATGSLESHIGNDRVLIIPTPERVIKARFASTGATFFVNLCSSQKVRSSTTFMAIFDARLSRGLLLSYSRLTFLSVGNLGFVSQTQNIISSTG